MLPTTAGPCLLRPAEARDAPFLQQLFAHDKAADFAAAGLPPAEIDTLIAIQYRGQAMSYTAAFPDAWSWIVEYPSGQAARLLESSIRGDRYVIDIAVDGAHRRSGVATALLQWLKAQAEREGAGVSAQVYRQNQASRALFAGLGFMEASEPDDPQVRVVWRPA